MRRITYFSPFLISYESYLPMWEQIQAVFEKENELYDFVPNAKDIWVRDFMPFQRPDGNFVVYRYNPDYLQGKNSKYITNCRDSFIEIGGTIALSSNICHHTNLIIDGGNMIKCKDKNGIDCVIMTTKVLYENPHLSHHEILLELEDKINAEVILIPWDTEEKYGHSDGMVRSLGEGHLLLNCYADTDKKFNMALIKALWHRFEVDGLSFGKKYQAKSWCHLNYLELQRVILVPVARLPSDETALKQIEQYTGKKCIPIEMAKIVKEGGAMHCISWTMNPDILFENKIMFGHPIFQPQCQ